MKPALNAQSPYWSCVHGVEADVWGHALPCRTTQATPPATFCERMLVFPYFVPIIHSMRSAVARLVKAIRCNTFSGHSQQACSFFAYSALACSASTHPGFLLRFLRSCGWQAAHCQHGVRKCRHFGVFGRGYTQSR